MDKFLVTVELKHDSLDELQYFNYVFVALEVFIFDIPPQLDEEILSALSVKDCKHPFYILFQNFLSVNKFLYFSD